MKYYIIAGEASGDLHGSNLMKSLYAQDSKADIRFWGGELMNNVFTEHQTGQGLVHDYKEDAVMGFSQVLRHLPKFIKNLNTCKEDILQWRPDAVILIDYPGFNFKIAEFARKKGYKVFYYIAPKVWASRESRIEKLKAYVDKLFIIFPFEIPYFQKHNVNFIYKGNPLTDAIASSPAMTISKEDFLKKHSLGSMKYIALLAGSRKSEISSMLPVYKAFALRMRSFPQYADMHFIIAGAPAREEKDYRDLLKGNEDFIHLISGDSYSVIRHAEAAVVNSGTASLETALIGTPQAVTYKCNTINYLIGKMILKIKYISLGNLIADREVFKEMLQHYCTSENITTEITRLIEDEEYRRTMLEGYEQIKTALGGANASSEIAKAMIAELQ